MRLTRTTAWVGGTVLLTLLAATATWFLLVGPRQEEAAALREQTVATASTNDALAAQVQQLEMQLADVPATRAEVARLREQVPVDAALPDLLRQVSALAEQAGVELTGVTPTEPVVDPAAAAVPTPVPSATSTAAPADGTATDGTATDGTATDGTTTDGAAAAPAEAAAVPGVETVPVTITAEGTFPQVQELLRLVQVEMARAVLVRGVTMTAGESGTLQLSMTAEVFTLPATDADARLAELAASPPVGGGTTEAPDAVPTEGVTPVDVVAASSGTSLPTSSPTGSGAPSPQPVPTTQTTGETQ
ncbi:type 4a pilus biogenesis protein PilO [Pseudokineococcus basanitobsidens]|uniref:Type 4a pilus biogenesis protein PilO n=1 Tax=Pseudokineococcus basanitobsidens TaxID=1926649 RepID=A0ABU8RHX5_9ACTN